MSWSTTGFTRVSAPPPASEAASFGRSARTGSGRSNVSGQRQAEPCEGEVREDRDCDELARERRRGDDDDADRAVEARDERRCVATMPTPRRRSGARGSGARR